MRDLLSRWTLCASFAASVIAFGACGSSDDSSANASGDGGSADGGEADGSTVIVDGSSPADAAPHIAPPACTTLATLPMRTPTYYVDFSVGDDTHDGKSEATAWKHAPGDASATGVSAAVTLKAGDVVLLKGGVPYEGTIALSTSGTASAPIVLEGGAQQGWGTGKAIIDGATTRSIGVSVTGASYVIVEGFEVRDFDKTQSSTGISVDGGDHDLIVGNDLHDIYYAMDPTLGGTIWEQQRGTGISVNNSPNTDIYANFVRDVGNAGIAVSADGADVSGGNISCNEITNMNWGIAAVLGDSKPGTHLAGLTISHNYIHDFDQYYVCNAWHRDGIFVFARPDSAAYTIDDIEIADNYFEDNTSAFGSTAWIYVEFVCRNFNIHHNILNLSRSYYAIRILGDGFQVAGNHIIANNVIANTNGMGSAGMHIMQSSGAQITNNIFYDDDVGYFIATDSMTGYAADYNVFWRTTSGTNVANLNAGPAASPGSNNFDLAGMQKQGYELHSVYGDPMWSATFASIDADPKGFKPASASPAKDKGKLLSYAQDYAGTAIPTGAGPDIGAFEQ